MIIGNHLAQHRQLSLVAIGLAVYMLSLPDGRACDIRTLAERFPEGRDRIGFALRELEAAGYFERVRERVDGGRFVTRTDVHDVPGRSDRPEAAVEPVAPPVVEAAEPEPEPEPGPPSDERQRNAEKLLVGLRRTDNRLTLSRKDVRWLVPRVVEWLENGVSRAAVYQALTADLPVLLQRPAGFLAYRLKELAPPPLPPAEVVEASPAPVTGPSPEWYAMTDCTGPCGRPFRAPKGAVCRDCRDEEGSRD
ncbi:helix-turn-helix domain-containing protein [Streptomyces sp. JW3]